MKIFVSYASKDRDHVLKLVEDLRDLDHEVWFDQELKGGQQWWEQILQQIRDCELFVFALTQQSLDSKPCELEYHYAHHLSKRILPVLLEDVNLTLLPPELVKIQFVDYRQNDKKAALALNRSLNQLPPYLPLPAELPDAPPVPVSPLNELAARLNAPQLSADEQRLIFSKLSEYLHDPESEANVRNLLLRFRRRDDLLAKIDRDIQAVLDNEEKRILPRLLLNDGQGRMVSSARFLPDGKHVIAGYHESTLKIWDIVTGKIVDVILINESVHSEINDLAVLNDDTVIGHATGGYEAIFKLNWRTGKLLKQVSPPEGYYFYDFAVSPDNRYLATSIGDYSKSNFRGIIYDFQTFEELTYIAIPTPSPAYQVLFSPDSQKIGFISLQDPDDDSKGSRIDFVQSGTWQPMYWWTFTGRIRDAIYIVQEETKLALLFDFISQGSILTQIILFLDAEHGNILEDFRPVIYFHPYPYRPPNPPNRLFIRQMPVAFINARMLFSVLDDGTINIHESTDFGDSEEIKSTRGQHNPIAHLGTFSRKLGYLHEIVDVSRDGNWVITDSEIRGSLRLWPTQPSDF